MPVPAGISFPMITFSLSPSRLSLLPWIAASVSTLVVSWNEAADSHDSVASDEVVAVRSEEHTSALQSHRDLHSFPTRRSSDLVALALDRGVGEHLGRLLERGRGQPRLRRQRRSRGCQIGRAHVCTPVTPRSTLFPYTTLFRSCRSCPGSRRR